MAAHMALEDADVMTAVSAYEVTTLSKIDGMKFSRNNGRNSKNIQQFPRLPFHVERKLQPRQVAPVRVVVKCPSPETAASVIVTLTMLPETRSRQSAWFDHECEIGSKACRNAPVYLGICEAVEGCEATIAFHPKKVWRYNHAMKKNLGRRKELHCIQYSVFQHDCCVFTCFGPTFELENKKREQSSRKRRLALEAAEQGHPVPPTPTALPTALPTTPTTPRPPPAPSAEPWPPTALAGPGKASTAVGALCRDEKAEEMANTLFARNVGQDAYVHAPLGQHGVEQQALSKRRREIEECMALDNTLATVYLADTEGGVAKILDDPDLMFLRKAKSKNRRGHAKHKYGMVDAGGRGTRHCGGSDHDSCDDMSGNGAHHGDGVGPSQPLPRRNSQSSTESDESLLSGSELMRAFDEDQPTTLPASPPTRRHRPRMTPAAGSVGGSESDVSDSTGHTRHTHRGGSKSRTGQRERLAPVHDDGDDVGDDTSGSSHAHGTHHNGEHEQEQEHEGVIVGIPMDASQLHNAPLEPTTRVTLRFGDSPDAHADAHVSSPSSPASAASAASSPHHGRANRHPRQRGQARRHGASHARRSRNQNRSRRATAGSTASSPRGSTTQARHIAGSRAGVGVPSAPPLDGAMCHEALSELPPATLSTGVMHVGTDGVAQFSVPEDVAVTIGRMDGEDLDALMLPQGQHSHRRKSRTRSRQASSSAAPSSSSSSSSAPSSSSTSSSSSSQRRAAPAPRRRSGDGGDMSRLPASRKAADGHVSDDDDNQRLVGSGFGDGHMEFDVVGTNDTDSVGSGSSSATSVAGPSAFSAKALLWTTMAVLVLAAIIVTAAVLVFQTGHNDEDDGTSNEYIRPEASCSASAWSQWSLCCSGVQTRTRTILTGSAQSCDLATLEQRACAHNDLSCDEGTGTGGDAVAATIQAVAGATRLLRGLLTASIASTAST